jgi:hypothetical protein
MRKSQLLKTLGTVAVAVGAVAGSAMPASAATSPLLPTSCGVWYDQTCTGFAQDVPSVGSSGSDLLVTCAAAGTHLTDQGTIVRCYIEGNEGDVHYTTSRWTQGPASATVQVFPAYELTSRSYHVCVGAGFVDEGGQVYEPDGYSCGITFER